MDYAERQANRDAFRGLIKQTSIPLTNASIAQFLGISESYAEQLWGGSKPMSGPIRSSINKILGNSPAPLSPLNQAEPDPVFAPVIERAEPMPSAQPENKNRRYMVVHMDLGNYALVEVLAPFRDAGTANLVCDLLNKEAG